MGLSDFFCPMKRINGIYLFLCFLFLSCSSEDVNVDIKTSDTDNGIPVVYIDTKDGTPIEDKVKWKESTLHVKDKGKDESYPTDINVKGRGNSSFQYKKKPFNIDFSKKVEFLGMPKAKKWVCLANYRDRTLLRNDLTFYIGSLSGKLEWTPQGRFVDIVFNGNYEGNYYVCEKININKQHINIDEITEDDVNDETISGGYLLQLDQYYDEQNKFRTERMDLPVEILSPDEDVCNEKHIEYISNYLNTIESLLQEGNFQELYEEYIDLYSFVDYYIVQIIAGNNDFKSPRSVYMYKKRNGKLYAGPLWDFDFSTYCNPESDVFVEAWWYEYLLRDVAFISELKARWAILKPLIESKAYTYIGQRSEEILLSAIDNFYVYPYESSLNFKQAQDAGYMMSVDQLIKNLKERIEFINTKINEK